MKYKTDFAIKTSHALYHIANNPMFCARAFSYPFFSCFGSAAMNGEDLILSKLSILLLE